MYHFQQHQEFFDKPIRLSDQEKANPISVIEGFFTDYRLSEIRELNQQMDHICLSTDSPPFQDADERDRLLGYREDEEKALEAAFLIWRNSDSSAKLPLLESSPEKALRPLIGEINLTDVQKRIVEIQHKVAQLCHIVVAAYGAGIEKLLKP
jgi:hypothetical protein